MPGERKAGIRLICAAPCASAGPIPREAGGRGMVGYAKRRMPGERPSKDQRRFLEALRDLGPRDNAQTAAVRKSTKRACQVRGWAEWRCLDVSPGMRAWHLTIIGRNVLNYSAQRRG
jgi:hypothetical protein